MYATDKLNTVLQMALSGERSLKDLARMSGDDVFSFYEGASLGGLDLAHQDLRGMNFSGADLRSSNLSGIKFDAGSLNAASVDPQFVNLQDIFDVSLEEGVGDYIQRIHFYGRFRPGELDNFVYGLGLNYGPFAQMAEISQATLRSARRGKHISMDTIAAIARGVSLAAKQNVGRPTVEVASMLFKPSLAFTYIAPSGKYRPLSRNEVYTIVRIMRHIDNETKRYSKDIGISWRESPGIIAWTAAYVNAMDDETEDARSLVDELRFEAGYIHPVPPFRPLFSQSDDH